LLHSPTAAVGSRVVAQARALACDPGPERVADPPRQARDLVRVEAAGRTQGVNACAPQGLVDVDVPQAGDRSLVEQRRLDGSPPSFEPLCEPARREGALERLAAEARGEVWIELGGLEELPRTEAAHISIRD